MNLKEVFGLEPIYLDWNEYKARIDFIDEFYWQQSIRKESIKNSQIITTTEK